MSALRRNLEPKARDRQPAPSLERALAPGADGAALREALGAALGTTAVVAKRRRLLLWEDVRIHLDEVEGLGAFVELEAVAGDDSDLSREHAQVQHLRDVLRIGELREGS